MLLPEDVSPNSAADSSSGCISRRSFLKTATVGAQMLAVPAWEQTFSAWCFSTGKSKRTWKWLHFATSTKSG
jgi:hypothetical protein